MTKLCKTIITVKFCSYLFVCYSEGKYIHAFRIFFVLESESILLDKRTSTKTEYGRKEWPMNCGCKRTTCHESDENI